MKLNGNKHNTQRYLHLYRIEQSIKQISIKKWNNYTIDDSRLSRWTFSISTFLEALKAGGLFDLCFMYKLGNRNLTGWVVATL